MVSLIWKYYSVPVAVVPSKWITPLDRLVAFPTRVAGEWVLASVVGERGEGAWRERDGGAWWGRGWNVAWRGGGVAEADVRRVQSDDLTLRLG